MIAIGTGWGLALVGAVTLSATVIRPSKTLSSITGRLHGVALCLIAADVLLVSMVYGPVVWSVEAGARAIWLAAASLILLIGIVDHSLGHRGAGKMFDLISTWLVAVISMWGIALLLVSQTL